MAEKEESGKSEDRLDLEDVGIPLEDVDEEPIPLDDELLEESEPDSGTHGDGDLQRAARNETGPDEIYSEIMDDQTDLPPSLIEEDDISEDGEMGLTDAFDTDVLPLSELQELPEEPSPPLEDDPRISAALDKISGQIEDLEREFQSKLKYDAHKEKIIDTLHQELQGFKDNLIRKVLLNTFKDIIKVIDDIHKMITHYVVSDTVNENPEKILSYLQAVPSDLEDILLYQGVNPFSTSTANFDPNRQRVMNKVPTDDPDQDKTIAERLRPGYKHEDRVIRPELVNVYVYSNEMAQTETRSSDE